MTAKELAEYNDLKCRHTQKVESDRDRIKVLEAMIAKGREDRRFTAAVAAMSSLIPEAEMGMAGKVVEIRAESLAWIAVKYADALLAELGKGET